jgi:hypothetical protein
MQSEEKQMTISTVNEIPEELFDRMAAFVIAHPDWDGDRVLAAALTLFLGQMDALEH